VLYRKRESASGTHEHSVLARFRYNDLKEDAGGCGGCGLRAGPDLTAMGIESFFVCSLLILHGLGKSEESGNRSYKHYLAA
jgi:hypothetical protein